MLLNQWKQEMIDALTESFWKGKISFIEAIMLAASIDRPIIQRNMDADSNNRMKGKKE